MKEPLMSVREWSMYVFMFAVSIFSIWVTLQIFQTDSIIFRLISFIPAGLITAVWISMNVGILSALKYRDPKDP